MNEGKFSIAIVGQPLSGKDAVGRYISQKYGFAHVSTGQLVRNHIKENNLGQASRELMMQVGSELRNCNGVDFFIKEALKIEENINKFVIDGLRAMGEIDAFKNMGGVIIAIDTPIEERYKRAMKRRRESDLVSFEEFKEQEEAENCGQAPHEQSVNEAIDKADFKICNEGSLEDLFRQIDELMANLLPKFQTEIAE